MSRTGMVLLQDVAERIIVRWLNSQGKFDVHRTSGLAFAGGRAVDITFRSQGVLRRVKVKPDPYFGTDPKLIEDRRLSFYRLDSQAFGFEAVANVITRERGWVFESNADDFYYYYLAIAQPEDEVAALMGEPDEVFFPELQVARDDLVIMPARETRVWFEMNADRYTPRPVVGRGASAWYRFVPRAELERAISSVRDAGPIFATIPR